MLNKRGLDANPFEVLNGLTKLIGLKPCWHMFGLDYTANEEACS